MNILILAGGSGTRFWPVSRRERPKQLLALVGGRSLLRQTLDRVLPLVPADRVWVCTTTALAAAVRAELPEIAPERIVAEPVGRNTAAAIGWTLRAMPEERSGEILAVLASDHWVARPDAFRAALVAAERAVLGSDSILTLGVVPTRAETGFGYLEVARELDGSLEPRPVVRFTEKPDAATARRFVEDGRHLWNAGIFVFRVATLLGLLDRHQPELAAGLRALTQQAGAPLEERYRQLPAVSIDQGVMERHHDIATVPLDCGWSDLGSWEALADLLEQDASGNRRAGSVVAIDAEANLLYTESGTIAVLGVRGLAVIKTSDAVLIVPRERAQEVRGVVRALEEAGLEALL